MAGQFIQVAGSLLILAPFGLAQLGRLDARSRTSLLLNLAGNAVKRLELQNVADAASGLRSPWHGDRRALLLFST